MTSFETDKESRSPPNFTKLHQTSPNFTNASLVNSACLDRASDDQRELRKHELPPCYYLLKVGKLYRLETLRGRAGTRPLRNYPCHKEALLIMPKYKSNVNDIWRDYHAKVSEYAGKGKPTKALLDSGVRMNADSIGEANMGQFFSLGLGCHTQRGPMGRRFRLDWHITIGRPSRTREYDCEIKGFFSFEAIAPMLPVIYANMDGYSLCDLLVMGPVPLMRVADPSTFCPVLSSNDYICAAAISEPDQHGCMLWEYTEFDDNMIGFTRHCSPEPRYPDSQIWEIWSDVLTNRKRLPGQLQLPYTG